jgi:hypothetical protein
MNSEVRPAREEDLSMRGSITKPQIRAAGVVRRAIMLAVLLGTVATGVVGVARPALAADPPLPLMTGGTPLIPISPGGRLPILPPVGPIHFVPNTFLFWDNPRFATTTDPPKPAYADVSLEESNFLPCQGGPFALCYYSGPDSGSEDLSCTLTPDGRFANCRCFEIPYGSYFVLNTAILNYAVYQETLKKCGADGKNCSAVNSAPVCDAVNQNRLIPGADLVSTFSFDCAPSDGLGSTSCSASEPPYAGCMTAPCQRTDQPGIVECSCPVYDGQYQVGLSNESCDLGGDLVWSAAYAVNGPPYPSPSSCVPDAPGTYGCPLYDSETMLPPGTDCNAICEAYSCATSDGVEPAYTCDATLCTQQCNDRDLVGQACGNLGSCPSDGTAAIIALESEVGCSCCASQLCGCSPNAKTNAAIGALNQAQRDRGITPQCDVNGTLCGD